MTTVVQDSQTPRCITCDYPLLSLSENRCPECGRSFDPADPRTVRTPRSPGKVARFFLQPPGWPMHIATAFAALFSIAEAVAPIGYFLAFVITLVTWVVVVFCWLTRWLLYSALRRKYVHKWTVNERSPKLWLVTPAALIATIVLLASGVPFSITFWLSRPSMDAFAKEVIIGTNPKPPDRWVGLLHAQNIEKTPTGIRFVVCRAGFIDWAGFIYSTSPIPEGGADQVSHVDDEWYSWIESF